MGRALTMSATGGFKQESSVIRLLFYDRKLMERMDQRKERQASEELQTTSRM